MEGRLAVPFHFAVEFLVLVVAIGAALDALRARRHGAGLWSLGQAAGFIALAVGQVMHGALLAQADADRTVIAIWSVAFLLLAVSTRPAEHVLPLPVAAAPALFFPGADPEYAFVPAALAMVVALRGVRAHRNDQDPATFAFAAAFVCFGASFAATALAPEAGGTWIGVAHAMRGLAALFLVRWLYSSVVRSVRMRVVAALVLVLTITVLLIGGAVNVVVGDRIQEDQLQRLSDLGGARVQSIHGLGEAAINSATLFARSAAISEQLGAPRPSRADLDQELTSLIRLFDLDFIVAIDSAGRPASAIEARSADRTRIGRIPPLRALQIVGLPVVREAPATGVQVLTVRDERSLKTELVAIGSQVVPTQGRRKGKLAVGYKLDTAFLRTVKADTGGAEASLVFNQDTPAISTLPSDGASQEFREEGEAIARAQEANSRMTGTLDIAGERYATAFIPISTTRDRAGESTHAVAMLALSLRSNVLAEAQLGVTRTLFLLTLAAMLVAALLAWLSGGRVTRPIRALTVAARELSGGNLEARTRVTSADEVGALGSAFNDMAGELQRKTGALQRSALTEASLRARLEAVLQSMGDALIATDEEGRIVTFNRTAEAMFRKDARKVVGHKLSEVMQGTTRGGRPLSDHAMGDGATDGTLTVGRAHVPIALTAAPLLDDDDNEIGRVIVLRDVTSEHQAERMKSEFLANVSHELRTPITPIKGYAEILTRKNFSRKKVLEFLEAMLDSVGRLERIADILVDFAALEAGKLKAKSEPVPVRALLDGVTARWREKDGTHRFVRKGGDGLPPVLGDARLLDRSLDELIDNAVKFSPEGGPIEITAEAYANGSRKPTTVRITVRDRGIGIEPDRMPELFQDFRQLDGSETRAYGGLGLGLAYVKRIATMHGGDVVVDSKPGRGSAFSIVLPVADAVTKRSSPRAAATKRAGVKRKIGRRR